MEAISQFVSRHFNSFQRLPLKIASPRNLPGRSHWQDKASSAGHHEGMAVGYSAPRPEPWCSIDGEAMPYSEWERRIAERQADDPDPAAGTVKT